MQQQEKIGKQHDARDGGRFVIRTVRMFSHDHQKTARKKGEKERITEKAEDPEQKLLQDPADGIKYGVARHETEKSERRKEDEGHSQKFLVDKFVFFFLFHDFSHASPSFPVSFDFI